VAALGGTARIIVSDFFSIEPSHEYDAVIGNPPYVRYQDWTGELRARSRAAALRAGVPLSGLASSWASFTVQSMAHLRRGGRLGLVLPAELLSVNYAAPVRRHLFENFRSIDLVLFDKQLFEEAEADTVLLMADGYGEGQSSHASVHQTHDAASLGSPSVSRRWTPGDPAQKWSDSLTDDRAPTLLRGLERRGDFVALESWGKATLGMVTGNNRYFALTTERVRDLGLSHSDLVRLSPPGSAHLRRLSLTSENLRTLDELGQPTWLFRPAGRPSVAAREYIAAGETAGVNEAYKCRVRSPWYLVPLVRPADLLLTYMNAEAVQLTNNAARVHHVNSVHGVNLRPEHRRLGKSLLPLAALNSATLLSGELVGRSYGGGILKIEPREANRWLMPSPRLVERRVSELRQVRRDVLDHLTSGRLEDAVALVDSALFSRLLMPSDVHALSSTQQALKARRNSRSRRG
jgi:hypothetical protein